MTAWGFPWKPASTRWQGELDAPQKIIDSGSVERGDRQGFPVAREQLNPVMLIEQVDLVEYQEARQILVTQFAQDPFDGLDLPCVPLVRSVDEVDDHGRDYSWIAVVAARRASRRAGRAGEPMC